MKILLFWQMSIPEVKILIDELEGAGHEIVYWVGEHPVAHLAPKSAVFHDHYEAWDGKPAEVYKDTVFSPPSAELIHAMRETESMALTMMNKHYDAASAEERKEIYYSMLQYWNGVLDRLKPDAVVHAMVPHAVYDYIAYELARARGLHTIMFDDTWIAARLLYYRDFRKGSEALRAAYEKNRSKHISPNDLHEELRYYYEEQTKPKPPKPPYLAVQRRSAEGLGLFLHRVRIAIATLRRGTFFRIARGYLSHAFKKNLRHEYSEIIKSADLSVPYVYLPLGFQPERTTSPQGGIYCNQILVAETVAAALPEGWELYVKEHPSQWWMRSKTKYSSARYRGFYERLAAIPRVRVVPIETDSHTLVEHSKAVATVTGTAGWEALLRGRSPLVFGYPWYMHCPGVIRVSSVEECREALKRSLVDTVSASEILTFLKSLEEASLRAYIGDIREFLRDLAGKEPDIPRVEQMRIISTFLKTELARE